MTKLRRPYKRLKMGTNMLPGMTGPPNSFADRHFVSTASCVKTTRAFPSKKLWSHEIKTNISSAYEN